MPLVQRISQSNHKLYHEALRWTKVFVNLALLDGVLLFLAAAHVLGISSAVLLGLQQGTLAQEGVGGGSAAEEAKWRASALSLATAGAMGLLIALLVRRCCRFDRSKSCVVANWHDLSKYTHMGRAITAAMTAVLTWRGLESVKDVAPGKGGIGRIQIVVVAGATLSMATAALMHHLHHRIKAIHVEYSKLQRDSSMPKRA